MILRHRRTPSFEPAPRLSLVRFPSQVKCYQQNKRSRNEDHIIITFNIWLITVTKSMTTRTGADINNKTIRTSWMANNAIPDSIIINMICRYSFLPPTKVGLTPVAMRILNTIMPVTKVFTAMDAAKPVTNNVFGQ